MFCDIDLVLFLIPLIIISMIFSLIVPFMYFVSPKTRHHPAILYLSMSVLEYMQCYQILVNLIFVCNPSTLDMLVYFSNYYFYGIFFQFEQTTFQIINQFFIFLILELQILRDICFCIDILLTLKIPFYPPRLRIRFYGFITFLVLMIRFIIYKPISEYLDFLLFDQIILIIQTVLIVSTLIMILQTLIQSRKIKVYEIQKAKTNYLKQVTLLLVICEILWVIYFAFYYFYPYCLNTIYIILGICQGYLSNFKFLKGILSGLIRCEEFFFRSKLLLILKHIFGQVSENELFNFEESGVDSEVWCVPLGILMGRVQNQTLITNILKGVMLALEKSEKNMIPQNPITESVRSKENIHSYLMSQISEDNIYGTVNSTDSISHPFIDDIQKIKAVVVEYAPQIFARLRNLDDINFENFSDSLSPQNNQKSILQAQESVGKSGAFFFFTQDKKFLIKTITTNERQFLLKKVLIKLSNYLQSNRNSTLAMIYGCFSIQLDGISAMNLILMENSLSEISRIEGKISVYDLKGSRNNRQTKHDANVQKDINYLISENLFLFINHKMRMELIKQLDSDSNFLRKLNIMDYSLLLGIKDQMNNSCRLITRKKWRNIQCSLENQKQSYSFAIIDYLQQFNIIKYIEYKYKSFLRATYLTSCIFPRQYKNRFLFFMNLIIVSVKSYY